MHTAKKVIPVGDLGWDEQETGIVAARRPFDARVPAAHPTRRLQKIDSRLLALSRFRSVAPAAPAGPTPKPADARPVPPKPYVKASATPAPPKTEGPVAPRPLAVQPFLHQTFAMQARPPRTRVALPSEVLASPPSDLGGATMPAPPPSMTGGIVVDEAMFDDDAGFGASDERSAPVSLADEHVIDAEAFQTTGTIEIDDDLLEELAVIDPQEITPESFWMRGKAR